MCDRITSAAKVIATGASAIVGMEVQDKVEQALTPIIMPKELKDDVAAKLNSTAKELYGIDNFVDMIADETVTEDMEELYAFLSEKGHPVLGMDPLL